MGVGSRLLCNHAGSCGSGQVREAHRFDSQSNILRGRYYKDYMGGRALPGRVLRMLIIGYFEGLDTIIRPCRGRDVCCGSKRISSSAHTMSTGRCLQWSPRRRRRYLSPAPSAATLPRGRPASQRIFRNGGPNLPRPETRRSRHLAHHQPL